MMDNHRLLQTFVGLFQDQGVPRLGIPGYMQCVETNTVRIIFLLSNFLVMKLDYRCDLYALGGCDFQSTHSAPFSVQVVSALCVEDGRCSTAFPGPASMAATFNDTLWEMKGDVISTGRVLIRTLNGVEITAMFNAQFGTLNAIAFDATNRATGSEQ